MKTKILCLTLCALCIMEEGVFAREAGKVLNVSLESAIDMALEASEDLKLQNNRIRRRSSEKNEQRGALLPQVTASVEWSNHFEYPDLEATAATRDYHANAGLSVSQTLFTFGKISHAVSAAQKGLESSRLDRETTEQTVIYDTKIAFYNMYLAGRTLDIAAESYRNALKNKEILEGRASGGRAAKYDNIKISADIASRKPTVNNARADFLSAMETLKVVIGAESNDSIELIVSPDKKYPDFDRQDLAAALHHNQPDIKALMKNIEQKQAVVKSKKAALLPEISAFASWNRKGDGNDYDIGSDHLDDYGVAGVKVSVPLWAGGINREKLYQARIDKRDAELRHAKGEEDYLLSLDKALNKYKEYKKTLTANKEAVHLAEESFHYSQELFGSGQISVTDLNDAELQLTNAKINKEITLFNLNRTLAVIERLTLMEHPHE